MPTGFSGSGTGPLSAASILTNIIGISFAASGSADLPTNFTVSSGHIHDDTGNDIGAVPDGWDSSDQSSPATLTYAGTIPLGLTVSSAGAIALGIYFIELGDIYEYTPVADTVTSIPYGFTWDGSSIKCDTSLIAVTTSPIKNSTIDTATGIITLPANWDFDGANLYYRGAKDIFFPTGMYTSTLSPYTKAGSADVPVGSTIGDMFASTNLAVHSGAIIKLGAGSKWSKDITVS